MKISSFLRALFGGRDPAPRRLPPLPEGKLRIHLFSGNFETMDAALAYCYHTEGEAAEQITREQPGAFIDTGFVEVVYQNAASRLAEFLDVGAVDRTIAKMKGANTLIIITEDAFGGFAYELTSNDTLFYIGPFIVDV